MLDRDRIKREYPNGISNREKRWRAKWRAAGAPKWRIREASHSLRHSFRYGDDYSTTFTHLYYRDFPNISNATWFNWSVPIINDVVAKG